MTITLQYRIFSMQQSDEVIDIYVHPASVTNTICQWYEFCDFGAIHKCSFLLTYL